MFLFKKIVLMEWNMEIGENLSEFSFNYFPVIQSSEKMLDLGLKHIRFVVTNRKNNITELFLSRKL